MKIRHIRLTVSHPFLGNAGEHDIISETSVFKFAFKLIIRAIFKKDLPPFAYMALYINGICYHRRLSGF